MNTIRYKLVPRDIKYLSKEYRGGERIFVKRSDDPIWVNILEVRDEDWAKLRLYFSDGSVQEGWTWQWTSCRPVEIHNIDELFDGRFNQ